MLKQVASLWLSSCTVTAFSYEALLSKGENKQSRVPHSTCATHSKGQYKQPQKYLCLKLNTIFPPLVYLQTTLTDSPYAQVNSIYVHHLLSLISPKVVDGSGEFPFLF